MRNIKRAINSTFFYLRLAEFRFFWFSTILLISLLVINTFVLTSVWVFVNGGIFFIVGFITFLGSSRLAKLNLQEKSTTGRLNSIITNLSDGVIAYDNNFRIIVFNKAAERIFGITGAQIIGQSVGPERASETSLRFLTQVMFPSLAPVVVRQSDVGVYPQVVDLSFSKINLRVSTDRILDENNQVIGFVKLIKDRTREINLLKSKSEFITIAAHQLRTPLTAVNWIFEGFAKLEVLDKSDRELAGNGLVAAHKLLKIVNDLLDVSKIEEGRFGYKFRKESVINFITEVLSNAQAEAKEYGIKIYFDKGSETVPDISIDPDRLALAVSNLVDNAIRYNVKNGSVTVSVNVLKDKPYVQISVKDTGIGIPPEDMSKVFSKFHRSANVLKKETEGSGLGLYITKNIINRHGGVIWAESTIDRGTTFHFTLPTDPNLIPPKEVGMQV